MIGVRKHDKIKRIIQTSTFWQEAAAIDIGSPMAPAGCKHRGREEDSHTICRTDRAVKTAGWCGE